MPSSVSPVGSHRSVRYAAALACSVVSAVLMLFAAGASSADASQAYFCPTSGTMILINGNGGCTGAAVGALVRVYATTSNGYGVDHCAVGKQYSDGGGANVIPSQCGLGATQITGCYSARFGYPKISNRSSSAHYFEGDYDYNSCFH